MTWLNKGSTLGQHEIWEISFAKREANSIAHKFDSQLEYILYTKFESVIFLGRGGRGVGGGGGVVLLNPCGGWSLLTLGSRTCQERLHNEVGAPTTLHHFEPMITYTVFGWSEKLVNGKRREE